MAAAAAKGPDVAQSPYHAITDLAVLVGTISGQLQVSTKRVKQEFDDQMIRTYDALRDAAAHPIEFNRDLLSMKTAVQIEIKKWYHAATGTNFEDALKQAQEKVQTPQYALRLEAALHDLKQAFKNQNGTKSTTTAAQFAQDLDIAKKDRFPFPTEEHYNKKWLGKEMLAATKWGTQKTSRVSPEGDITIGTQQLFIEQVVPMVFDLAKPEADMTKFANELAEVHLLTVDQLKLRLTTALQSTDGDKAMLKNRYEHYLLGHLKPKKDVEVWGLNDNDEFEDEGKATTQKIHLVVNLLAFTRPTFGTRKPDVAIHIPNTPGRLGVVVIGDIKGYSSDGRFQDSERGHVLGMATEVMNIHKDRFFMYAFLTDTERWQFFKVNRWRDGFKYEESQTFTGTVGWQNFFSILCATPLQLGYQMPIIEGYTLTDYVGSGSFATVYSGHLSAGDGEEVLLKIFAPQDLAHALQEVASLKLLAGNEAIETNVPKLIGYTTTANCSHVVITTPKGRVVAPLSGGAFVFGSQLGQLCKVLQVAADNNMEHRDIKPDNLYFTTSGKLFLSDWSSSRIHAGKRARVWVGSHGFSEPHTEECHPNVADLRALVRTAWSLLYKENPPPIDSSGELSAICQFWKSRFSTGVWGQALQLADTCQYDQLAALFTEMCATEPL